MDGGWEVMMILLIFALMTLAFFLGFCLHALLAVPESRPTEGPTAKMYVPPAPVALPPPAVAPVVAARLRFMNQHERGSGEDVLIDARLKRPTMYHTTGTHTKKYMAARQAADGAWIYREVLS